MVFVDWLSTVGEHESHKKVMEPPAEKPKKKEAPKPEPKPETPAEEEAPKADEPPKKEEKEKKCTSAFSFLAKYETHTPAENETKRADAVRKLLHTKILPALDVKGGEGVTRGQMVQVMDFIAECILLSSLKDTRFVWEKGVSEIGIDVAGGLTSHNGDIIKLDLDPPVRPDGMARGNQIMTLLLHECCHAVLKQHVCRGKCGNAEHAAEWQDHVKAESGHGKFWFGLAKYSQTKVNELELLGADMGFGTVVAQA